MLSPVFMKSMKFVKNSTKYCFIIKYLVFIHQKYYLFLYL